MQKRVIFKIVTFSSLLLLATACATPGGGTSMAGYSATAPVCLGDADCQAKMSAAGAWVSNYAGLQPYLADDMVIETYGWGMEQYTAVHIQRAPLSASADRIVLSIHCGENGSAFAALGCPDAATALDNFNNVVSAAGS